MLNFTEGPGDEFKGNASIGYGSFNDFRLSGSLNGPIFGKLSASVTGFYHSNDGHYKDIINGGSVGAIIDATGNPVIRAPKHTGNIAIEYARPAFGGDLSLSANLYASSGFAWEPGNRVRREFCHTLAMRAVWSPEGSNLETPRGSVIITDEEYIQGELDSSGADGVSYAPPRWAGIAVSTEV